MIRNKKTRAQLVLVELVFYGFRHNYLVESFFTTLNLLYLEQIIINTSLCH